MDLAWVKYPVAGENNVHESTECSNMGICDRKSGECECFDGYEGIARGAVVRACLLYTSPSPRDRQKSRMPSSA